MKRNRTLYWKLFCSTFYLSSFTFGGGFVIVPLMKKKFVEDLKWIEEKEMLDLTAIAQSSPGAIAVNTSIILGYRVGGILGALVSIIGTVAPPFFILSVVSLFYNWIRDNQVIQAILKGMQAGIAAIIVDVVINMGHQITKEKNILSPIIMICAFVATYFFKVNVIILILSCGLIGLFTTIYNEKRKGEKSQ